MCGEHCVTSRTRYGEQGRTEYTPEERHIHVKNLRNVTEISKKISFLRSYMGDFFKLHIVTVTFTQLQLQVF
jgi:hypothetical protein